MKYLLIWATFMAAQSVYATEKLICNGEEGESIAITRAVSPGTPSSIEILQAALKKSSAHLNTTTIVRRINNRKGLSYIDILGPKSFQMTVDRSNAPHLVAEAIMDQGMITEAKFSNLHCVNEGSALPEMPACPAGDLNKALLYAAAWGDVTQGELLLDCGAKVDALNGNGHSSLQIVTGAEQNPTNSLGLEDWMKLLIGRGADVNRKDLRSEKTSLHYLTDSGHISELDILLENKANINAQDVNGMTALMIAVQGDNEVQVRTFLNYKPNLTLKNKKGKNAYDLAVDAKFENIADLVKPQARVATVKGLANGTCSPAMIHVFVGQEVAIELTAPEENMFLLTAPDFNLELMAMPGESAKQVITPKAKGNFKFECGVHGAPEQTHGTIMVM